jgi:hypothetical protein
MELMVGMFDTGGYLPQGFYGLWNLVPGNNRDEAIGVRAAASSGKLNTESGLPIKMDANWKET